MSSIENSHNFIPNILNILYKIAHKTTIDDETKFKTITHLLNVYDALNKDTTNIDIINMINDLDEIKKEFDEQKKNNSNISFCINKIYAVYLYSKTDFRI
jgi:hypothetical protein